MNNKTRIYCLLLAPLLLLTQGCNPMRYSQYTGQKSWPVAMGAMAETQYKVQVYRGWPDQPYNVIGSIRFVDRDKYWDDGVINMACAMAKKKGGNAIIIRYGSEYGVGMITGAVGDPKVVSINDSTALVIKWKTPAEIEAERASLDRFVRRFGHEHPNLIAKKELVNLAIEYVRSLNLNLESIEANQQLEQVLTEVLISPKDGQANRWLFRGTVKAGSLTTSSSDFVYGVATVTQTGESLTIVSSSARSELNFSGSVKDGRLSGQLGFSAGPTIISAKAEGVYTLEKISLTGQGQTADGTFQGSFSFSR